MRRQQYEFGVKVHIKQSIRIFSTRARRVRLNDAGKSSESSTMALMSQQSKMNVVNDDHRHEIHHQRLAERTQQNDAHSEMCIN
ncbi:hypothetical protein T10_235 [Trichinella papuae]|uniref:Uncharacterized protein n=1 Tax=Trichinella papuae TaxID=268474 RepID=A0A0V1MJW3_9BILA|nr:hypothetical protein T10_235 [Trichinella papuae]